MADYSSVPIVWVGPAPQPDIIVKVREDIARNLASMERPSRLVYHHVQLTADLDGPCVVLWGKKRQSCFYAEYKDHTRWVSINELDDMVDDGKGSPDE